MVLASIVVGALFGTLLLQQHRTAARKQELRKQLVIARALPSAHERMRKLLGDVGIFILGENPRAEVLRVTGAYRRKATGASPFGSPEGYPVAPTGEVLDRSFVHRLGGELLRLGITST